MPKNNDEVLNLRISFRGDRQLWWDFVTKIRKEKKNDKKITVWKVLEKYIREYINSA